PPAIGPRAMDSRIKLKINDVGPSFRSSEAMLTLRWQRSKLINLGASVRRCPFDHTGHKPLLRVDYIAS
ncbi:MAG: hypothetical protein P4L61_04345, partial [Candidatus Pacebacteria bacterium]|nr:hypothetical protein [Candidatus Paceibacterota bacterium]